MRAGSLWSRTNIEYVDVGATVLPSMPQTLTENIGADLIRKVAALSKEERRAFLDRAFIRMEGARADIVAALGEVERGQEGARRRGDLH